MEGPCPVIENTEGARTHSHVVAYSDPEILVGVPQNVQSRNAKNTILRQRDYW